MPRGLIINVTGMVNVSIEVGDYRNHGFDSNLFLLSFVALKCLDTILTTLRVIISEITIAI